MAESSREVARRFFDRMDVEQVTRIVPQLESVMRQEDLSRATAACIVSSLVGWFAHTLEPWQRGDFEQLIEAQMEMVAGMFDG